ncbi:hypothetical protein J6590_004308 [Homalodisca vitripennis]|nr:hypothetical protein J6590_004308 [Homalodisca vitripennis]
MLRVPLFRGSSWCWRGRERWTRDAGLFVASSLVNRIRTGRINDAAEIKAEKRHFQRGQFLPESRNGTFPKMDRSLSPSHYPRGPLCPGLFVVLIIAGSQDLYNAFHILFTSREVGKLVFAQRFHLVTNRSCSFHHFR